MSRCAALGFLVVDFKDLVIGDLLFVTRKAAPLLRQRGKGGRFVVFNGIFYIPFQLQVISALISVWGESRGIWRTRESFAKFLEGYLEALGSSTESLEISGEVRFRRSGGLLI